jgi:hypothetical protein
MLIFLGLVLLTVVGASAEWSLKQLRAGRESWPRGWRWLCRVGQHTPAGRYSNPESATDPCRYESWCTSCGRVTSAGPIHDHVPAKEKDASCVRVAVCRRCGDERRDTDHRTRAVLVFELDSEDRSRMPGWMRPVEPCDLVKICDDCGNWDFALSQVHDPEDTDFSNRCRRCGHWDDIGE